jgi:hypothetical protein
LTLVTSGKVENSSALFFVSSERVLLADSIKRGPQKSIEMRSNFRLFIIPFSKY